MVTLSGELDMDPSLTTSETTNAPAASGVNLGLTADELDSVALLPFGRDVIVQA